MVEESPDTTADTDIDFSHSDWPPLRDVIARFGLSAEKSLGQNFLLDQNITDKIVRYADVADGASVFEIGPGPGGLTRSLLVCSEAVRIYAVEFDPRAIAALQELQEASQGRLQVIEADALQTDLCALDERNDPHKRYIVANLPYNIATPLLIKWLAELRDSPSCYHGLILMFQKEVGQRIVASPGSKTYGRLAVMTQWLCEAQMLFDLPPSVFVPPPKVTSTVVRLRPRALSDVDQPSFAVMEEVVRLAFGKRRKMIRSALKSYLPQIRAAGLDETLRAENLSVDDFVALARVVEG